MASEDMFCVMHHFSSAHGESLIKYPIRRDYARSIKAKRVPLDSSGGPGLAKHNIATTKKLKSIKNVRERLRISTYRQTY